MNASQRSAGSSKPAAAAWPPYRTNRSRARRQRLREVDPAVRAARGADHVAERVPTTVGRPVSSASRPATSPRIPTGHGPWSSIAGASGPPLVRIAGASSVGTSEQRLLARRLARVRHAERGPRLGDRRLHEVLARRVRGLERRRELGGLLRRLGEQEPGRVERLPHPSGRVEPRRDDEAHGLEVGTRSARCPPRASSAAIPGRGSVRIRSSPSFAMARFSPRIGETSETVPIVARSARSSASASASISVAEQQPGDRERDAAARQVRERVVRVRAVRVDERDRRGQDLGQVVMVRDDRVDAALVGRGDLGDARGPGVDGDDQRHAPVRGGRDRGQREAVALLEPRRDVRDGVDAQPPEREHELREPGQPVRVEVAEDHDPLAALAGAPRPARRRGPRPGAGAGR